MAIEYKERGEIILSRKMILDALLLALTAGIVIVKAIYEMDSAPFLAPVTDTWKNEIGKGDEVMAANIETMFM